MKKLFLLFPIILLSLSTLRASTNASQFSGDTTKVNQLISMYDKTFPSDTAKSREYLSNAFELSHDIRYNKGIAESSLKLGEYYFDRYDFSMAESYYIESLKIFSTMGNKSEEAKIANNLGVIAEKQGNYSNSLAYYLQAFEIYDSLNNHKGISATANNLGIIYYLMNFPQRAKRFFTLSQSIKEKSRDTTSLIYTYQNLGNVSVELWQYDSALFYYTKALNLSVAKSDRISESKALNGIGTIELMKGNSSEAIQTFQKALNLAKMNNEYQNIASLYDNFGMIYFYRQNYQSAKMYFDSSLIVAKEYGLKQEMKTAYQHLADLYAAEKLYKEAFLNMQSYENIKSSLISERSDASGVESIFIKQKQENKILLLEKEKEKRKAQLILLGAILAIILITAALLYFINGIRQKSRLERTLAEQEKLRFKTVIEAQEMERKRIASDLHDSVGQMLSLSKLHLSGLADTLPEVVSEHSNTLINSMRIMDEACQEVRNISHNLMPGALIRLGLSAAVKDLSRKINSAKKIKITFNNKLGEERLDENIEISLFRIIQEIFNNSIKHANASEMTISLDKKPKNLLHLVIADNGKGFDPEIIKNSSGIGWKNIYSRLTIINGSINVTSQKKSGTTIDIQVNL